MKTIVLAITILGIAVGSTGCATSAYWTDRGRDAADIITLGVGKGGGAIARVGPLHAGLGLSRDLISIRGGQPNTPYRMEVWEYACEDAEVLLMSETAFTTSQGTVKARKKDFSADFAFLPGYGAYGLPFVYLPPAHGKGEPRPHFFTQIEVVAGLLGTVRLGFNPGELLDFIVGWTTFDIYKDDLEWRKRKSNKEPEATR